MQELDEYRQRIEEQTNAAIADLSAEEEEREVGGVPKRDLGEKLNEIIVSKITPIAAEYRGRIDTLERLRILKEMSDKIRLAFVPKEEPKAVKGNVDSLPIKALEISVEDDTQNVDFVKKIERFQKAQEEISKISAATPSKERTRILSEYLDIFIESGLNIKYKLMTSVDGVGGKLPEPQLVAENDVQLVKDVLNIIIQLGDPSFVLNKTTDREFQLICGHLQIPKKDVNDVFSPVGLGDKNKAVSILSDELNKLLPDLFKFSSDRALLESAVETAKTNEDLYENARKLMNLSGEQLYSGLKFEINQKIESFKRDNPGLEQKTEKDQLEAFGKLSGLAQEVFTPLLEERKKVSDKILGFSETLRQIEEYKSFKESIIDNFPDVGDEKTRETNNRLREAKLGALNNQFLNNLNLLLPMIGESKVETLEELDNIDSLINRKIIDSKPQLLMYDMIYNRLKDVFNEESKKQNLNLYYANIEKKLRESPDTLTPEEVYNYATTYELNIPGGNYLSLTDDNHREMIQFIKYGWGGRLRGIEYQGFRDGENLTDEEFVALRGIQAYMLYADTHTNDVWAEEDKTKVRESLDRVKFRRIDLLQMTNHPIIGPKMTAVLDAYLEQPTLRMGSSPDTFDDFEDADLPDNIKGNAPGGKLTPAEERQFRRRWDNFKNKWDADKDKLKEKDPNITFADFYKKYFTLNERLVYRMIGGKRKLVQLAADRCVKNAGKYVFYIGEEMLPGDEPYLEANSRFSYNSLAGANGRSNSGALVDSIIKDIDNNPERFGLREEDTKLEGVYETVLRNSLKFLVLALPTLTEVYAKVALQTQTSAHPYDAGDFFFNLFDAGDLSRTIHTLERYRLLDGIAHGLIYYKDFDNGKFGASAVADRLNYIKRTMEDGARAIFGDGAKFVVSQIDPNDRDRPDRLSIKNMYKLGPNERLSFPKGLKDRTGRVFPTKVGKLDGGYEPFDWSLFWIAGNAVIRIKKLAIKFYEKGSIKKEDFLSGVKNELTNLIKNEMGQAKMSDFGEVFRFLVPLIFHIMMRQSRSIDEHIEPSEIHEVFERSLKGASGQLGTLQDMGLAKGWVKTEVVDPLLVLVSGVNERAGYNYNPKKKNIFMRAKDAGDAVKAGALGVAIGSLPTPKKDEPFSGVFMEAKPGMGSEYFKDFIVPAIRSYWTFMVKEYDLHLPEEFPVNLESYGPVKNWILTQLTSIQGERYGEFKETLMIMLERLSGKVQIGDVIARPVDKK